MKKIISYVTTKTFFCSCWCTFETDEYTIDTSARESAMRIPARYRRPAPCSRYVSICPKCKYPVSIRKYS